MSNPSDIDYISKIDFSEGFHHFHIQWPLKDLDVPKRSTKFATTVVYGNQSVALSWKLCIEKDVEDPTKTWYVANLNNSEKIMPIIFRVSLSSAGNVLFDRSGSTITDSTVDCGHVTSASESVKFVNHGSLVLNFWLDIPKAVAFGDNSKKRKLCARESVTGFISDTGKMFSRVLGTAVDQSSDVTLIVVDKEENEIRRFQCHSIFLAARSSVFENMFAGDEWKGNYDRSVKIDDISEQVMETLLRFVYTADLPEKSATSAHLWDIIYAADKYNLDLLKNWCVSRLIYDKQHVTNRYEQLVLADRHNLVQLTSVSLAQLSLCFPFGFTDHTNVAGLRRDLWSEMMKAVSARQSNTTYIVLPVA